MQISRRIGQDCIFSKPGSVLQTQVAFIPSSIQLSSRMISEEVSSHLMLVHEEAVRARDHGVEKQIPKQLYHRCVPDAGTPPKQHLYQTKRAHQSMSLYIERSFLVLTRLHRKPQTSHDGHSACEYRDVQFQNMSN